MTAKSIALLFPGQGSQYVGMGKNLENEKSFELYEQANNKLGFSLSKLMLEGPLEELTYTYNAQPAIVTHSTVLFEKLKTFLNDFDVSIDYSLGHSVGEYSALVAAGVINFQDAIFAVNQRGKFMQDAVPVGQGTMFALMKVPADKILQACHEASNENEKVTPANYNEPNQTVISGHKPACLRAVAWLEENLDTPFRSVELQVSAPFHSPLMNPAAENLSGTLNEIEFKPNEIPYIANVNHNLYQKGTEPSIIKENLVKQVAGSVYWHQSFSQIPEDTLCIEVGPSRVLAGLARKINRNLKVISLDKEGSFESLKEEL